MTQTIKISNVYLEHSKLDSFTEEVLKHYNDHINRVTPYFRTRFTFYFEEEEYIVLITDLEANKIVISKVFGHVIVEDSIITINDLESKNFKTVEFDKNLNIKIKHKVVESGNVNLFLLNPNHNIKLKTKITFKLGLEIYELLKEAYFIYCQNSSFYECGMAFYGTTNFYFGISSFSNKELSLEIKDRKCVINICGELLRTDVLNIAVFLLHFGEEKHLIDEYLAKELESLKLT